MYKTSLLFTLSFFVFSSLYAQTRPHLDRNQIENLTGAKGELDVDSGVFKVTAPREDLKVNSMGVKLTPALGLTSWASFQPMGDDVEVMGDMVLLEDQINPVMQIALENGFHITALHNHYLWDSPKVMFMHIEGRGTVQNLATSVGKVFESIKKTSQGSVWSLPPSLLDTARSTIDPKTIDAILDKKGTLKEGVYKIVWGRTTQMNGHEMGAQMGVNTWAAFSGTAKKAIVLGDFAVKEDEVQDVLKVLLKHNIFIISLHQHMMGEHPKMMFVHYMGRGELMDLLTALKEALACIQSTKS
jgi:hypothetical protein